MKMDKEKINILLIEDNHADQVLIQRVLSQESTVSFETEVCDTLSMGIKRLREDNVDLVLLDLQLPDSIGLETLELVKRQAPKVPVVVMTGNDDEDHAFEALKMGAQDYQVKGQYDEKILSRVIRHAIERKHYEEVIKKKNYELGERVKELNCLYEISNLINKPGLSIEDILQEAVNIIPSGLRYPEIAGARITYGENECQTGNFQETEWLQRSDINVDDEKIGKIEVCYREEKTDFNSEPFLIEERRLLDAIAERIGKTIVRKQAEEELQESEERLQILFECAPDGFYLHDYEGKFIEGNREAERIIGYKREELIGKNFFELNLISPEDMQKAAGIFVKNIEGNPSGPDEIFINRKDGSRIPVEIRTYPVKIKDQNMVLGIARDITERKKVEEDLKESEQRFRNIFDNATDGILLADLEKKVFYDGNSAICRMLGYGPEEIKKVGVMEIHPERDLPYVIEQFERQFRGEITMASDLPVRRKNGSVFYADINSAPITLGGKTYLMGIFRDITERKLADEEKERLIRDLHAAMEKIKVLGGMLPICASCKKIRDDKGYWNQLESYIHQHSEADFTHSICPECARKLYPDVEKEE